MSAADTAAVVIAIAVTMVVGALLVALVLLIRTLRALQATVAELQTETLASVREMHDAVHIAAGDLDRVDSLLATAESVSQTVDSASRLAYKTVTNPVVKTLALGTGARKAVRRMRHAASNGDGK